MFCSYWMIELKNFAFYFLCIDIFWSSFLEWVLSPFVSLPLIVALARLDDTTKGLIDRHSLGGCFGQASRQDQRVLVHLSYMGALIRSDDRIKCLVDHYFLDGCFSQALRLDQKLVPPLNGRFDQAQRQDQRLNWPSLFEWLFWRFDRALRQDQKLLIHLLWMGVMTWLDGRIKGLLTTTLWMVALVRPCDRTKASRSSLFDGCYFDRVWRRDQMLDWPHHYLYGRFGRALRQNQRLFLSFYSISFKILFILYGLDCQFHSSLFEILFVFSSNSLKAHLTNSSNSPFLT